MPIYFLDKCLFIFFKHLISTNYFSVGNESGPISPFHDIPLLANHELKTFNMVVEVPRWTNAKMEVNFHFRKLNFQKFLRMFYKMIQDHLL